MGRLFEAGVRFGCRARRQPWHPGTDAVAEPAFLPGRDDKRRQPLVGDCRSTPLKRVKTPHLCAARSTRDDKTRQLVAWNCLERLIMRGRISTTAVVCGLSFLQRRCEAMSSRSE